MSTISGSSVGTRSTRLSSASGTGSMAYSFRSVVSTPWVPIAQEQSQLGTSKNRLASTISEANAFSKLQQDRARLTANEGANQKVLQYWRQRGYKPRDEEMLETISGSTTSTSISSSDVDLTKTVGFKNLQNKMEKIKAESAGHTQLPAGGGNTSARGSTQTALSTMRTQGQPVSDLSDREIRAKVSGSSIVFGYHNPYN
eukprot:GFYU01002078.1.p1 GENE.GFYU01002078.1~~GFYU01002078.1.p1  ORF type:complete len:227 (-),score=33.92 GFYU01002078.1:133-732(-)